jgi:ATP-dependent protease ClpP protease subunit
MAVIVENNEIWLTGTVGAYWWENDGFTSNDVAFALLQVGRTTDIVVHLNSGGGLASEGSAIHSQLSAHKGNVEIIVEGIAASAASIVAMAANRMVMSLGATLMIHDPMVETNGNLAEHQKSIAYLEALAVGFADIYAEKTGKPKTEMRSLMAAETWMTAEEAVAAGFADATTAAGSRAANDNQPTAFAYRAYARAPAALVALADARGWKPLAHPAVAPTAKASTPPPPTAAPSTEDHTMTDKTTTPASAAAAAAAADAVAAAKARIKAITTAEAATGREALAAHLAYETEMSAEAAVAALEAAPKAVAETSPTDYAARRQAAAGLAAPGAGGDQNQPKTTSLAAAVATTNKRR